MANRLSLERTWPERADVQQDSAVLRFITAGSVDDGKSTLIGRLLHDSRQILEDQLSAVEQASLKRG
ncbi:MAG: adenylyl-sulfate kinase, partial [Pseudomonadota bacterium]